MGSTSIILKSESQGSGVTTRIGKALLPIRSFVRLTIRALKEIRQLGIQIQNNQPRIKTLPQKEISLPGRSHRV